MNVYVGYCQLTCGQCGCASTITQVLQKLRANTFLQAATQAGMKAQFDLPGFTATVLAPSDAAFTSALNGTVTASTTPWWCIVSRPAWRIFCTA